MHDAPQTWHYGLIARWWSEFNDDFRPHEIPYFRRYIERDGQPALDVACGTGRLLELEPLAQRVTLAMHAEQWRDGRLEAEEDHLLTIGLYFR